jgi:ribonuclease H / adenosylcobalamin/alpha-ribazole phosphatase
MFSLYCDGASRGNGSRYSRGGAGAVIFENCKNGSKKKVLEVCKFLGYGITNNVAEYEGLILGLEMVIEKINPVNIDLLNVYLDSKLVVEQSNGKWKCNKPHLKKLLDKVNSLKKQFKKYKIYHVLRHLNTDADRLANKSINDHYNSQTSNPTPPSSSIKYTKNNKIPKVPKMFLIP